VRTRSEDWAGSLWRSAKAAYRGHLEVVKLLVQAKNQLGEGKQRRLDWQFVKEIEKWWFTVLVFRLEFLHGELRLASIASREVGFR